MEEHLWPPTQLSDWITSPVAGDSGKVITWATPPCTLLRIQLLYCFKVSVCPTALTQVVRLPQSRWWINKSLSSECHQCNTSHTSPVITSCVHTHSHTHIILCPYDILVPRVGPIFTFYLKWLTFGWLVDWWIDKQMHGRIYRLDMSLYHKYQLS